MIRSGYPMRYVNLHRRRTPRTPALAYPILCPSRPKNEANTMPLLPETELRDPGYNCLLYTSDAADE